MKLTATQRSMLECTVARGGAICPGSEGVSTARALVKRGLFHNRDVPGGAYYVTQAGRAEAAAKS